jgi:hypothetical protein
MLQAQALALLEIFGLAGKLWQKDFGLKIAPPLVGKQ